MGIDGPIRPIMAPYHSLRSPARLAVLPPTDSITLDDSGLKDLLFTYSMRSSSLHHCLESVHSACCIFTKDPADDVKFLETY